MIAYIKGGFDTAFQIARTWARQNGRYAVKVEKGWHDSHPLDSDQKCYIVGPRIELPECSDCAIFAHGHKTPAGIRYLSLDTKGRELQFTDFLEHYNVLGDKRRDPYYAVMMKDYTPRAIVASYLYVKYKTTKEKRNDKRKTKTQLGK